MYKASTYVGLVAFLVLNSNGKDPARLADVGTCFIDDSVLPIQRLHCFQNKTVLRGDSEFIEESDLTLDYLKDGEWRINLKLKAVQENRLEIDEKVNLIIQIGESRWFAIDQAIVLTNETSATSHEQQGVMTFFEVTRDGIGNEMASDLLDGLRNAATFRFELAGEHRGMLRVSNTKIVVTRFINLVVQTAN